MEKQQNFKVGEYCEVKNKIGIYEVKKVNKKSYQVYNNVGNITETVKKENIKPIKNYEQKFYEVIKRVRIKENAETFYNSQYKYIIGEFYHAYATFNGFIEFLKNYNYKIKTETIKTEKHNGDIITFFSIESTHKEVSFWNKRDIPNTAKKFIALNNGSYVECYTITDKSGNTTIYRPNPNAKTVYKPFNYFNMQKIYG